jgi:hypothetical protein
MRPMNALLLCAAGLLVGAPVADAAKFKGRTAQGRAAELRTNDEGLPARGKIVWRATCSDGNDYSDDTGFKPPFDFRSRARLRDKGDYSFKTRDGYRMRAHAWIRGRRVEAGKWRGRFGLSLVVRRNGRFVARCKTGIIGWRVSR